MSDRYVVLGIDPGRIEGKRLAWDNRKFADGSGQYKVMEWTSAWPLVLLVEFREDGLSPSVSRFRRKETWEKVTADG